MVINLEAVPGAGSLTLNSLLRKIKGYAWFPG
jgi:hypothetical protein